jgi:FixJ family two-component response regulator
MAKIQETPLSTLFPREIELLAVLAKGWTDLQIAATMGILENTVRLGTSTTKSASIIRRPQMLYLCRHGTLFFFNSSG